MKTKRGPGRPKLPKGERAINVGFRLPPLLAESLRRTAEAEDLSMGILVKQILMGEHRPFGSNK